jgi:thioesterase domain-containing protein
MGGCVALEMARQWQQQGVAVSALIMIDSWTPPGGLGSEDARDEWRKTLLETDFLQQERESFLAHFPDDARTFARLERVLDSNRLAFVEYEPAWFDGEVDFLRATEAFPGDDGGFPKTCLSMDRGWSRYARQVTVQPVAGDHYSVIAKENAASLANTVRRIVDARLSFSQI